MTLRHENNRRYNNQVVNVNPSSSKAHKHRISMVNAEVFVMIAERVQRSLNRSAEQLADRRAKRMVK